MSGAVFFPFIYLVVELANIYFESSCRLLPVFL